MPTQKNNNSGALPKLKAFASGDGAHCGLTDIYPDKLKALEKALKAMKPFDTGWYSSKKEIASARVYSDDGKTVQVEVSVSDDFDTEGLGRAIATQGTPPVSFETVQQAIYRAWSEAEGNQKDNRLYAGFCVRRNIKTTYTDYVRGKPVEKTRIWKQAWVETFLIDISGAGLDSPPGDNYHQWGFQGEQHVPRKDRDALERWANQFTAGMKVGKSFTSGKWTIEPWKDED